MKVISLLLAVLLLTFACVSCKLDGIDPDKEWTPKKDSSGEEEDVKGGGQESGDTEEDIPDTRTKDLTFKKIVVGYGDAAFDTPPYKLGDTVYADLEEYADYFGGKVSYSADKKTAMVTVKGIILTFAVGKSSVTVADAESKTEYARQLSGPPMKTVRGMDVPAEEFAKLLGYTAFLESGVLYVRG